MIRREVLDELKSRKWPNEDIFGIQLALEEALVNAIRHGNDEDATKRVHVECHLADDLVRIQIVDEGSGFDPAQLPDPTAEEHREAPSGRGVLLMRRFMDRVEYNEKGNVVLLEKQRTRQAEKD